ncbi:MAG: hypothetical protein J0H53_19400 [Rhizobiales bacterium]|nr:hypothetical protein [Hyphomicrobiales bacterium]OJU33269.1 MAG: hypothetical protein BGN94_14045 [Rhizobiales bacterium 68-8]
MAAVVTKPEAYGRLLRLVEDQGRELNAFLADMQGQMAGDEFDRLREIVARIMGNGHYDALLAIAEEVPALKPAWAGAA